ncbi:Na+/H+ antiporter NhaD/arsenite permease-like protein [Pullulanibacillus pueri]|uniref:Membrane protein n=1 Tax=Pullulanibacillus pueri TaxID=1437324 RepID=A0A8J2ZXU6_9BACL|nr:ArsB/NhaD family transporter [Pullulanibacillus pueri]MBM7680669.1 Na+/H+ antiporter NhaD/arsenite permease-like protein [Pullulanibacillus pueri]GGH83791.1 membrane protein [Pullulanibacillus pueri]
MTDQALIALGLFVIAYAFIVSEKIHRTIVAMIGGLVMIACHFVTQESAIHHIDWNTLGLLTGMMIIVSITAETGLFKYIAIWSAKRVKGDPLKILIILSLITAVGSAFLDNVTTVLLIVPVTFSITRQLGVSPIPYLMSEIMLANIGGTATMIGDPPNIMIGSRVEDISFIDFINELAMIAFVIGIITLIILAVFYRKQLITTEAAKLKIMGMDEKKQIEDSKLLVKCLIILGLTIIGFFMHQSLHIESATVALAGAFLLLLLAGSKHLEDALKHVEWTTIFFFMGLFVLVGALVDTKVIETFASGAIDLTGGDVTKTSLLILWMSAIASAFVDNIPFVATMIPLIQDMGEMGIDNLHPLWWSLALGACLGGNGTLIGASANVIVAGMAEKEGHDLSFVGFMKVAFPLMILSIIISTIYVYLRYLI